MAAEEFPGEGVSALWRAKPSSSARSRGAKPKPRRRRSPPHWPDASLIALRTPERAVVFAVRQGLRPDARAVVAELARGHEVEILSGDREPAVALVARELGVTRFEAGLKPADKIARLKALAAPAGAR